MRFNSTLIRELAHQIVRNASSPQYGPTMLDLSSNFPLTEIITSRWVQSIQQAHNIMSRSKTDKLLVSPLKQEKIHREVAFHLGQLHCQFSAVQLNEEMVFNANGTHFLFDANSAETLEMKGDENVKVADVVSGAAGMTMLGTISGGREADIRSPVFFFQNVESSYPIGGCPDDVTRRCHRTGPRGWMDRRLFLSNGRKAHSTNCARR